MPSIKARVEALEAQSAPTAARRLPALVINIDPRWSTERREQVIQAAHERAGRPWPVQWQPGDPPAMVLIHMHMDDGE